MQYIMDDKLPKHIRLILVQTDHTLTSLAKVVGRDKGAISRVMRGHTRDRTLMAAIAKVLHTTVAKIWPKQRHDTSAHNSVARIGKAVNLQQRAT